MLSEQEKSELDALPRWYCPVSPREARSSLAMGCTPTVFSDAPEAAVLADAGARLVSREQFAADLAQWDAARVHGGSDIARYQYFRGIR